MREGISIVIPTVGRASLDTLLAQLEPQLEHDMEVIVVRDVDRRGPASARNAGWRQAIYSWVTFLDDDVEVGPHWIEELRKDLVVDGDVGAVQGRLVVPVPQGRALTDWERATQALSQAAWITADIAYRTSALVATGGFDERFPRAFREDADLALRVKQAGWQLMRGKRQTVHPVRAESPWVSLRTQRGNADDVLLRRKYGRHWRRLLEIPAGRRARHLAITAAGILALLPLRSRALFGLAWLAGTAEFAWARIAPGPRTRAEVGTMLVTSALIPPLASWHWVRGWLRRPESAGR